MALARSECCVCGLVFKSYSGFSSHRVGQFQRYSGVGLLPSTRRCLTTDELRARGFHLDAHGRWRMAAPVGTPWRR